MAVVCAMPVPAAPGAVKPVKRGHRYVARYRGVPTFADSSSADDGAFDDPIVRAAAISALGRYNGAVVAVDPSTGRILTVVNQKIAFGAGYIPCSTIKPTIALAALEENVITRDTMLKVGRRKYMNLTEAMAHSNNVFFEQLGSRMGFETVSKYYGGVARMSSFGEGIQVTPLQLAALSAAFANGGTLYYLQYPHTQEEVENFTPRVKRELNIGAILPELREGMLAAVLYGTGKSSFDRDGEEMPLGKTGTCDDHTTPSKIGWFITYNDDAHPKIAFAVLLRGNTRSVKGPTAAVVAGRMYRKLREQNYFSDSTHAVAVNTGK